MYRKRCQHCQQMFIAERKRRTYCTRRCSTQARKQASPDFYREMGRKGGTRSGATRSRTLEARLRKLLGESASLSDAYRLAKQNTRRSLYGNGWRAGYRAGWAEALGER